MKQGQKLENLKSKYIVVFKCMVNSSQFRTMDDFQLNINEFKLID
jgi:hypothetical protein